MVGAKPRLHRLRWWLPSALHGREPATSPGKNRKGRISSKYTLHQRQVDPKTGRTYEPLLTCIANLLTCGLYYVTHHNNPPVNCYCVETSSVASNQLLVEYMSRFPIMSSKRLNFEDWAKVHQMNLSKEHLAAEGKAIIKQLKAGMNTGRSSFTWEHAFIRKKSS